MSSCHRDWCTSTTKLHAGTLPAFLAQSLDMRIINVADNLFTALEESYLYGGEGMPIRASQLSYFRVSSNEIDVSPHTAAELPATHTRETQM